MQTVVGTLHDLEGNRSRDDERHVALHHVATAVATAGRRGWAVPYIGRDAVGHDILHGGIGVDIKDALVVGDEGRGVGLDVVATVAGRAIELEVGRHTIAV